MAEELNAPSTKETTLDWFSEGYPALQDKLEIVAEGDVTIPVSRYEELVRAEHTIELIKRAHTDKSLKYDSERAAVIKVLLGMETEDE